MSVNTITKNEHKYISIDKMIDEIVEYMKKYHTYPNVMSVDRMIKKYKKHNDYVMQVVNYYKIGKHGKIEELTDFDRENIDRFPEETVFYKEFPEEAIKLDI